MIARNRNSLCEEAKLYYYDFLSDESRGLIPESISDHIEQCQHCREQIDQLKVVLSQTDGVKPEQGQVSSAITTMLKLHFAYIGERVTCETVRPFLPGLLDPALEIRIPTPITAHLDNCKQCSEDLEAIRELNLNRKQLCRLSQFLAEKPSDDSVSCSQAQAATLCVALMIFRETSAAVLKHFCTCPNCRNALYQYRESVRTDLLHSEKAQKEFPCEEVSATDIFDYCLPYGIDPAADQYAKFRESLTLHLCSCPTCLAKMQELHRTIYNIADRAESEVVTIYHIDESAKVQAVSESDDLYAGFPISVEIASRENKVDVEKPVPTIDFITALKRKVSATNLKLLLKAGIAVAAVILIGLALLFNTPTAKAVTIEQIYKAIEKVKNVYISSFVPDKTEPTQERWVSRTLNIYMTKTKLQWVLQDIANGLRKSKDSHTGVIDTVQLTEDDIAGIEQKISGPLGLVPFYDISEIPPGAEWHQVANADVGEGDTEVYELTWTEKAYDDSVIFKKWRFFIDPQENLPQKVEIFRKSAANSEYNLRSARIVEYLSDNEIQSVIKDAGF
ncbi:MAG: hypothetical protein IIB56_19490 [Planctomycetes bacterium]|nr:hypothetical protein [Planctomycetota bacterium]